MRLGRPEGSAACVGLVLSPADDGIENVVAGASGSVLSLEVDDGLEENKSVVPVR